MMRFSDPLAAAPAATRTYAGALLPNADRFCDDWTPVAENDPKAVSPNQALTGNAPHPKFLVRPFVAAPSHDLEAWKASDLTRHSAANRSSAWRPFESGTAFLNQPGYESAGPHPPTLPSQPFPDDREPLAMAVLQPGVYHQTVVTQPINALLGISMTPQLPVTGIVRGDGYLVFRDLLSETGNVTPTTGPPKASSSTSSAAPFYRLSAEGRPPVDRRHDARLDPPPPTAHLERPGLGLAAKAEPCAAGPPSGPETVFDPRSQGPGDASTAAYEALTGQVRYPGYRERVDAARQQPLPWGRSHVDAFEWAATAGEDHQKVAVADFIARTNDFRAHLSHDQMRKGNELSLQRRILPIRPF